MGHYQPPLSIALPRLFALGMLMATTHAATAADTRAVIGACASLDGSLVWRESEDKPWNVAKKGDAVYTGDLLLAIPRAAIELKNSGIQFNLEADLEGRSPFPIIETAVVLHANSKADLDFTLDRGRVVFANRKEKGPAQVIARFGKEVWDFDLLEPGAKVGMEIYGRWPRGVHFKKDAGPEHRPAVDAIVIVLEGSINLKVAGHQYLMKAPPGRALFHWDGDHGPDQAPHHIKQVPPWAEPPDPARTVDYEKRKASGERFRALLLDKGIDAALDDFVASDDPLRRRFAVYAMGALDHLPHMAQVLMNPKHDDVWDHAVIALRHWLGRSPDQDMKLYKRLIEKREMPPADAETLVNLLHSFGDKEVSQPALYELLIEYLKHDQLGIRGLAHWHLTRLVPSGRTIVYHPNGTAEERERAYQEWKKLVPNGKLPPKPQNSGD